MSQRKYNTVVLVLKKGGDYHFSDAEILSRYLHRFYSGELPLRVICLNDVFSNEVILADCHFIPMQYKWKGWWSKFNLFTPEMEQFRPFLYMDLDTTVVKDYTEVFNICPDNKLVCLRDFYHLNKLASGLMWVPADSAKVSLIWDTWILSPDKYQKIYRGDQEFMRGIIRDADLYWQDITNLISSFKPKTGWLRELPADKSIICFHGNPRPRVAKDTVEWVSKYFKGLWI